MFIRSKTIIVKTNIVEIDIIIVFAFLFDLSLSFIRSLPLRIGDNTFFGFKLQSFQIIMF